MSEKLDSLEALARESESEDEDDTETDSDSDEELGEDWRPYELSMT